MESESDWFPKEDSRASFGETYLTASDAVCMNTSTAVSYTHLDVYKRQALSCLRLRERGSAMGMGRSITAVRFLSVLWGGAWISGCKPHRCSPVPDGLGRQGIALAGSASEASRLGRRLAAFSGSVCLSLIPVLLAATAVQESASRMANMTSTTRFQSATPPRSSK